MKYDELQNGSDIRGIALGDNANLTDQAAYDLAAAFAALLFRNADAPPVIAVGTDSRVTGPELKEAAIKGITDMGADVIDCGMASTPAMFMTTVTDGYRCDGSIMITASHLPMDRNGMKFFTPRGGLEKSQITELIEIAENVSADAEKKGSVTQKDFMVIYAKQLRDKITSATGEQKPFEGFKIIVDAGNGAGGFYADKVLKPLGADIEGSQFLDPDGTFPNHIPNPENKEAMQSILDAVKNTDANFGIIFDTDVDRAGAVDKGGVVLNRSKLIAAISAILLQEQPEATIVTDSVTSAGLADFIKEKGGVHHRFKRGYKNIINEAIRLNEEGINTPIAIETSGHAAFKENYFLDDGAYLVTRLLIELAKMKKDGRTISDLIAALKEPAESVEFRLNITGDGFKEYGANMIDDLNEVAEKDSRFRIAPDNHEGIRVSFGPEDGDGWFLVRLSLHEPLIPVNIESDSPGGAKKIAEILYDFLKDYDRIDVSALKEYIENN